MLKGDKTVPLQVEPSSKVLLTNLKTQLRNYDATLIIDSSTEQNLLFNMTFCHNRETSLSIYI